MKGLDHLNSNAMDIPRVDDIPIISKLAKESEKLAQMDGGQQVEYKKKKKMSSVNQVIEADEDQLETHFVENPFIKIREKVAKKQRDGKVILAADDLEMQAAEKDKDVYIMQESGKMVVRDLEAID